MQKKGHRDYAASLARFQAVNGQNVSFGLMLDNDTVGRKASENLRNGLTKLGYQSEDVSSLLAPCKDANEALCANPRFFIMRIRKKIAELKQKNYARQNCKKTIIFNLFFKVLFL